MQRQDHALIVFLAPLTLRVARVQRLVVARVHAVVCHGQFPLAVKGDRASDSDEYTEREEREDHKPRDDGMGESTVVVVTRPDLA